MPSIGPLELGIVLLIVLMVFGPKRLPGLGRQLGSGMREFKDSITGKDKDDDDEPEAEPTSVSRGSTARRPSPRWWRVRRARRTSPPRARTSPERRRGRA